MNSLINYMLESGISLAVMSMVYIILLRRETFFMLNRGFLLLSLLYSILLPLMRIPLRSPEPMMLSEVTVTPYTNLIGAVNVYGRDLSGSVVHHIGSNQVLLYVYFLGLLLFLSRFVFRMIQILRLIHISRVKVIGQTKFVFLDRETSPFSFFNYIFISEQRGQTDDMDKIIAHEMEHIRQGHSLDVVLLEILTSIQWFNPFVWILKKVIMENHEFIADQSVINKGTDLLHYKKLLIHQSIGVDMGLANHFKTSLIKKRLIMLSKIRSSRLSNLKYGIGLLPVIVLFLLFACEQKESVQMDLSPASDEISLTIAGDKLQLLSNSENIDKLKAFFNQSKGVALVEDSVGLAFIVHKDKDPVFLDTADSIYPVVDYEPVFVGGREALISYISNHVSFPKEAVDKGIQGKVFVQFVVSKTGEVVNCEVKRGVDDLLDKEALRVIQNMPHWIPGTLQGVPVNVQFTIPINFALN